MSPHPTLGALQLLWSTSGSEAHLHCENSRGPSGQALGQTLFTGSSHKSIGCRCFHSPIPQKTELRLSEVLLLG